MALITERRIVTQEWWETESSKTGWDSHGWSFADGHDVDGDWNVVEHITVDKFGNPWRGIAERQVNEPEYSTKPNKLEIAKEKIKEFLTNTPKAEIDAVVDSIKIQSGDITWKDSVESEVSQDFLNEINHRLDTLYASLETLQPFTQSFNNLSEQISKLEDAVKVLKKEKLL
jgi:hypothetical protein